MNISKLKRRLAALTGAVILTFALSVPAFAANASTGSAAADIDSTTVAGQDTAQSKQSEYQSLTDSSGSQTCNVYATLPSSFTVKIPKTVILTGNATEATGNYSVRVSGDVTGTVSVEPSASFTMTQSGKSDITATVTQAKTSFTASEVSGTATTTGVVSAKGLTSGSWSGAFTFTIGLVA